MSKISKYFVIQELVPESIFEAFGEESVQFIDPRLFKVLDALREHFNAPIRVNTWYNWKKGPKYQNRGFRHPNTTVGGRLSAHKRGQAADFNVDGFTPKQVYNSILANKDKFLSLGLTTMENIEDTPTWNHVDCRIWTDMSYIHIVKP